MVNYGANEDPAGSELEERFLDDIKQAMSIDEKQQEDTETKKAGKKRKVKH